VIPPLEGCELESYRCSTCQAHGVRLFRSYATFINHSNLLCQACALIEQKRTTPDNEEGSSICWRVAAIPSPPDAAQVQSFWGYTSAPQAGVDWWHALPIAKDPPS